MSDRYAQAMALRAEGMGFIAIAKAVGVTHATAENWINAKSPKASKHKRHASYEIDPARVSSLALDSGPISERRTMFPSRVFPVRGVPRLLIAGHNSRKTGSMVAKGPWQGMPIYTLTLQERATCPSQCFMFRTCYGNGMHWARRIEHGHEFEFNLIDEVAALAGRHKQGFVVRLHILGDFYSPFYVSVWHQLLDRVPQLHVFGYTARSFKHDREIATAVEMMNAAHAKRCFIRFSSPLPKPGGATVIEYKPDTSRVSEGIVCPAELSKSECCATCGLCWSGTTRNETIVFVKHGNSFGREARRARTA